MRRWLCSPLAVVVMGACTYELGDGASDELIETPNCDVSGLGMLPDGDVFAGSVHGSDSSGSGSWVHIVEHDVIQASPTFVFCRINGAVQADFAGEARVNGRTGYEFRVHVEDVGDPEPGRLTPGTPEIQTVSATRYYRPTRWEDGTLRIDERALVTIPHELPVTVGNAGNMWAWITIERSETFDTVVCRYRGGASSPLPCDPADLAAGSRYVFDRCTGELPGTDEVEAGDTVDVRSLTLHVHTGAHTLPSRHAPQTTVTVDFEVTPLVMTSPPTDFYRMAVWEIGVAEPIFFREGEISVGNLRVAARDL